MARKQEKEALRHWRIIRGAMAIDKDLAHRLVDRLEQLYLENSALRAILMVYQKQLPSTGPWERLLDKAKTDEALVSHIQGTFAPIRQRFAEDIDLAEAIAKLLKVVPFNSTLN